jgi:Uma2 family endonuclease
MIGASRMEAASMASLAQKRITVEEFLAGLTSDFERLELTDGVITAMVGGTLAAARIARNVVAGFQARLQSGRCETFGDNTLLKLGERDAVVPDAMIVCSSPPGEDRYVTDPTVIVEVLSPSTESFDRGFKWLQYQTIPSLRHYLLVAQDRHLVEMFSRGRDDRWIYAAFRDDPTAEIRLDAVGVSLILAEVYEGVTIASADATP